MHAFPGRRLAVIITLLFQGGGCVRSSQGALAVASAKQGLAGGVFKENCAMGFEIAGNVYTEWADVLEKVVAFRGEILGRPDLAATAGQFAVKITQGNATYPKDKVTVIRWHEFTGTKVAKRVVHNQSCRDTRAEAEAELTESNGYFEDFCCPYATRYTPPGTAQERCSRSEPR